MFLKNYTSEVPVSETIRRIENVLIRCGVCGIMKEYLGTSGEIGAITFQIESPGGKITIRLPADKDKALEALWLDYADGDKLNEKGDAFAYWSSRKKKRKKDFAEQAAPAAEDKPAPINTAATGPDALRIAGTLRDVFSTTDLAARLDNANLIGLWLSDWRRRGWIETVGTREYQKTGSFGKV